MFFINSLTHSEQWQYTTTLQPNKWVQSIIITFFGGILLALILLGFFFTSPHKQGLGIWDIITLNGLILLSSSFCFVLALCLTMVMVYYRGNLSKNQSVSSIDGTWHYPRFFAPKFAYIGCIIFGLLYYLSIIGVWIPSLPLSEQKTPFLAYGSPIFLIAIQCAIFAVLVFFLALYLRKCIIIIDKKNQMLFIHNRTSSGVINDKQFALKPDYLVRVWNIPPIPKKSVSMWCVSLDIHEEKLPRIFISRSKQQTLDFAQEFAALGGGWRVEINPPN